MRQRTGASRTVAEDAPQTDADDGGKRKQQEEQRLVLLLVGLVLAMPLLVAGVIWFLLPHVEHKQFWSKPQHKHAMDNTSVGLHLRNHTMLHIGGLHYSGTAFLTESLAKHRGISMLKVRKGVDPRGIKNLHRGQGLYVQHVYPIFGMDHTHFLLWKWVGEAVKYMPFLPENIASRLRLREGIGRFALDPDHHLDESTPLVAPPVQEHLFRVWARFWDLKQSVLVERSALNLVISPFLHRLWGLGLPSSPARFIFLQRHPIVSALATTRMAGPAVDDLSVTELVEHWLAAEERKAKDVRQYFERHEETPGAPAHHRTVTLEELCREPKRVMGDLYRWLGLPEDEEALEAIVAKTKSDPNAKYFKVYCRALQSSNDWHAKEHAEIVQRFRQRILDVSSYDLQEVPQLCEQLLLEQNETGAEPEGAGLAAASTEAPTADGQDPPSNDGQEPPSIENQEA